MIICFEGLPGAGKTYEAVQKIIDNLRKGRVVYTNIDGMEKPEHQEILKQLTDLNDYGFEKHFKFLTAEQMPEFWNHVEPGCLVVLDELQKVFSSREWQTAKNNQFHFWASTHRHQGFDVVIITQDITRIDSAIRSLVEWTYVFRKVNFLGNAAQRSYLVKTFHGEDTGGKPLSVKTRLYDSKVFACYKSYVAKDVKELGVMQHLNVLKHPVFYAIPLVACLAVYMIFFKSSLGTGDIFGTKATQAKIEAAKKEAALAQSSQKAPPPAPPNPAPSVAPQVAAVPPPVQTKVEYFHQRLDVMKCAKGVFFMLNGRLYKAAELPYMVQTINNQYFAMIPRQIEVPPPAPAPAGGGGNSGLAAVIPKV